MPREISNPPDFIKVLQTSGKSIDNSTPNMLEIRNAIKVLKSNKSSLDVSAELLKVAIEVENFANITHNHISKIWEQIVIPSQWNITRLNAIWKKKGSIMDPLMYRGISVGSIMVKLVMNIVFARMSDFYESQLLPTQLGFRKGKGCNDSIYIMKQLQEIAVLSNRKLYTCYVDLSAAYDHINRSFHFQSI